MNQRRRPIRSRAYLAEVRRLPCAACAAARRRQRHPVVHAHHVRRPGDAMGRKPDDTRTIPLCLLCHRDWHAGRSRLLGPCWREVAEEMVAETRARIAAWGLPALEADAEGDVPAAKEE